MIEDCNFCADILLPTDQTVYADSFRDDSFGDRAQVFHESDNFLILPGTGPQVEGYIQLVTRDHLLSIGNSPAEGDEEFEGITREVDQFYLKQYGQPALFFEHGTQSIDKRGASCHDHAHVHGLPLQADRIERISSWFAADYPGQQNVPSAQEATKIMREIIDEGLSYLWMSELNRSISVSPIEAAPSQYFRRLVARALGDPDLWDWPLLSNEPLVPMTARVYHQYFDPAGGLAAKYST